jgi:hypothetical protein
VAALGITTDRAGRIIRRPGVSPAKVAVHRRGHSLAMAKADVLQRNNKVRAWPGATLRGNKGAAGVLRGHHPVRVRARVVLRGNKADILRAHRPVTAAEVVNKAVVAEAKAVTAVAEAVAVADEAVKEDKAAVEVVAISRLTVKRSIAPNKRKCGDPTSAASASDYRNLKAFATSV